MSRVYRECVCPECVGSVCQGELEGHARLCVSLLVTSRDSLSCLYVKRLKTEHRGCVGNGSHVLFTAKLTLSFQAHGLG